MKPFASIPVSLPHSGIREIMDMTAGKEDIIHLEVGQPEFPTPDHIVEATCKYLREGYTKYVPSAGMLQLREVVADYFEKKTKVKTGIENIAITPGAIFSIATAFLALLEPGDEVLLPDPGWPNYTMASSLVHAKPVYYRMLPENSFLPRLEEMEGLLTPKTKLLLICNPANPTGQVYNKELIKELLQFARRNDLYVLSDEIYSELIYEGKHISALSYDTDDRTLIVSGVSKSYAMTGYRVGFTRARSDYIKLATKLQEAFISCGSGFSQLASVEAFKGSQDILHKMVDIYRSRRDLVVSILKKNGLFSYKPGGALYQLIDISSTKMDSMDFAIKLLNEKKVAVAPGKTFGQMSKNHIRISYAASEEDIREGIGRICEMILNCSKN